MASYEVNNGPPPPKKSVAMRWSYVPIMRILL